MKKLTKAQQRALAAIAARPNGTFHEQFPRGVDSQMIGRMREAGVIAPDSSTWTGSSWSGGYRLTDIGRTLVQTGGQYAGVAS